MRMMDAIVKPAAAPGLELRQVPVPTPGAGEVLIKVHKTAICGTDVHIYNWDEWSAQHVKPPMVIGHEYVGEIAELGAGRRRGLPSGQRVSGEGHITCGHCRNCHAGNDPVVQEHHGRRRGPRRRVCRVCLHPGDATLCLSTTRLTRTWSPCSTPSATPPTRR